MNSLRPTYNEAITRLLYIDENKIKVCAVC